MESERRHIAIVGGGLAGLAAAAYLGRAGHRVTLFERSDALGGRGATNVRDGYHHNFGPHALYRRSAAVDVLAELGIQYSGKVPKAAGVAIRGGRAFSLPGSARTMLTTRLFGVRARIEAGRHLLGLRNVASSDTRTVRQWLGEEVKEPSARDFLEAVVRVSSYANAPDELGIADAARQLTAGLAGVLYLDGGWQTLVDGLGAAATAAGAEVRRGARVQEVVVHGGSVEGVRMADAEVVGADAVLLATAPNVAAELAAGVSQLAHSAANAVPARAACLDLGLTSLPNPRRKYGLGMDVPFYLSTHSAYANLAPDGRVLLSVAKYIPAGATPDASADLAELEAFLDLVQPGWREREEQRQYLPNMVVSTALPRASLGGIAGRPGATVPGVQGLFVAGDWVGQHGWLADGALGSAREAAIAASAWLATPRARVLAGVS